MIYDKLFTFQSFCYGSESGLIENRIHNIIYMFKKHQNLILGSPQSLKPMEETVEILINSPFAYSRNMEVEQQSDDSGTYPKHFKEIC